ncbi:uncharacterized protein LOC126735219 [Anthonomus grandis grandis]|uniref:uncharacterized protein LOC126735219 n=1 Tax=Anthonomus grandis grandis TaxID=2921223 RepID=UPI002165BDC1|nr:uncharacterized protein LOC126735219 [Anthonomus grandis grandis]
MTGPVFLQWLKHFQKFMKASSDEKVLLIVDGHSSHKYIHGLIFSKEHGIVLLCLPPHCTHRLQPLDVSFFGPLKTYFDQAITKWLKAHPGRVVTQFQIGALLTEGYGKAATIQNATNGFSKTGICPLNPDVFSEYMFQAAERTNIPESEGNINIKNTIAEEPSSALSLQTSSGMSNLKDVTNLKKVIFSTSDQQNKSLLAVTVSDLSPIPVGPFISGQGKRKPRKHQGTTVLNSTPNLEEAKSRTTPTVGNKKRAATKKVFVETDSESENNPFLIEDDEDFTCIYCVEEFKRSKAKEIWLQCCSCSKLAHAECAGVDKKTKMFIYELCCDN